MSQSAGTLVTTHNATYFPPRFMPGYRGHCPTVKYDYGETYANSTAKYFQDYRSDVLYKSADPYCRGGHFPSYYTHSPENVISARARTWGRWMTTPKYSLSNVDFDRKQELNQFNKLGQNHREHYSDKSDTVEPVNYFNLPNSAENQFKKRSHFIVMSTRHLDDINLPEIDHLARRNPLVSRKSRNSSQRDREMRDVNFEMR